MSKVSKDSRIVKLFLERGVENVYPDLKPVEKVLLSGKKLKVYLGVDPTGPTLHIGHAIPLRKLAELQKLGHEIIFLIGDFTAMIGDPTDKSATRVRLTREQVLENCKHYKKQASRFVSFRGDNPAKFLFNSKWLGKMRFHDVVELASHFTVQQMSERDMFETRLKEGKPVYLHEFLYPLMQGYDTVAMDVDMEIGGNDQTFNMLAGRTLLKEIKGKEKFVLTTTLLADPTGKKMGKTEGNMITLDDSGEEMYGKVMSWTDGMIIPGFRLCTDVDVGEIERMEDLMKKGGNPVEYKHQLAYEVVKTFRSQKEAEAAKEHFRTVHQSHELPEDLPQLKWKKGRTIVDALVDSKLVSSKSDARRQIEQGGVKIDGKVVTQQGAEPGKGAVIQKGKRHFVQLV
ncbi:tyrosine--tRNA ligase [Candidatus Uhrbacteria bacterium]|nr:tyrosine--tRNA ligase [Candidatus Uhrbacteria bacterium]MBD3284289.1 tyrosine--tRNA ligase [Candidatus Uhrbacteria bacterium]